MYSLFQRIRLNYLIWKCERARRKFEQSNKKWLKAKGRIKNV
jgi:hypothetical protein